MLSNMVPMEGKVPCATCLYSDICKYSEGTKKWFDTTLDSFDVPDPLHIRVECPHYREAMTTRSGNGTHDKRTSHLQYRIKKHPVQSEHISFAKTGVHSRADS